MENYLGKVLLFGEYTILNDSEALVVPLKVFSGQLKFTKNPDKKAIDSNLELKNLLRYFEENDLSMDYDKFKKDIDHGLFFDSTIPEYYGVGSSGALIASLFSRYTDDNYDMSHTNSANILSYLAVMESYFHGTSSGIDPLCSLFEKPIHVHSDKQVSVVGLRHSMLSSFVLYDSGISSKTKNFVLHYKEKMAGEEFANDIIMKLKPAVDGCIKSMLTNNEDDLALHMGILSKLQYSLLSEMIPDDIRAILKTGL
jgi:mevalonate kinase